MNVIPNGCCLTAYGEIRLLEGEKVCKSCYKQIMSARAAHNWRYRFDDRFRQMSMPKWDDLTFWSVASRFDTLPG